MGRLLNSGMVPRLLTCLLSLCFLYTYQKVVLDLMTVDEAIDAMEAVGHDFFVFR
jgi:hypothetical protein